MSEPTNLPVDQSTTTQIGMATIGGNQNFDNRRIHTAITRLPSGTAALRNIPRQVNKFFTGRERELRQINEAFSSSESGPDHIPRKFVIAGLGGTGKSEVCLKYACDNYGKYRVSFGIDCTTDETTVESFRQFGSLCGLGENASFTRVKNYLISSIGKKECFLIIVDNADDVRRPYHDYFPSVGRVHILITSRNTKLIQGYGSVGGIELELLEPKDACTLLLDAAQISEPERSMDATINAAADIVMMLDCHTLALLHAGFFIGNYCPIQRYVEYYHEGIHDLAHHEVQEVQSVYRTVFATFESSAKQLIKMYDVGCQEAGDAIELLGILAILDRECCPGSMLQAAHKSVEHMRSLVNEEDILNLSEFHAIQLPLYAPQRLLPTSTSKDVHRGEIRWTLACELLSSLSLIRWRPKLHTPSPERAFLDISIVPTSMHLLVHDWARRRLQPQCLREKWIQTASLSALALEDDQIDRLQKPGLVDNVRPCLDMFYQLPPEAKHPITLDKQLAAILYKLILGLAPSLNSPPDCDKYIATIGQLLQPDSAHQEQNQEQQADLAEIVTQELKCRFSLQKLLLDYPNSVEKFETLLENVRKIFGNNAPLTVRKMKTLVYVYLEDGQFKNAFELSEQVIELLKKSRSDESALHEILSVRIAVATVRLVTENKQQGIDELEKIIEEFELLETPRHNVHLCSARVALIRIYFADKQFSKARSLEEMLPEGESNHSDPTVFPRYNTDRNRLKLIHAHMSETEAAYALNHVVTVVTLKDEIMSPRGDYSVDFEELLEIIKICLVGRFTILKPAHIQDQ